MRNQDSGVNNNSVNNDKGVSMDYSSIHGLSQKELEVVEVVLSTPIKYDNDANDGCLDYKDVACIREHNIINALGYAPASMPCADATPRSFGRWLDVVRESLFNRALN